MINKLPFHLSLLISICKQECEKTIRDKFMNVHVNGYMKFKKYYAEIFSDTTGKEIQSQRWGGNRQVLAQHVRFFYTRSHFRAPQNKHTN